MHTLLTLNAYHSKHWLQIKSHQLQDNVLCICNIGHIASFPIHLEVTCYPLFPETAGDSTQKRSLSVNVCLFGFKCHLHRIESEVFSFMLSSNGKNYWMVPCISMGSLTEGSCVRAAIRGNRIGSHSWGKNQQWALKSRGDDGSYSGRWVRSIHQVLSMSKLEVSERCVGRTFPRELLSQKWFHMLNDCGREE